MKLTLLDLAAAKAFIEAVRPVVMGPAVKADSPAFNAYLKLYAFRSKVDSLLAEQSVEVDS